MIAIRPKIITTNIQNTFSKKAPLQVLSGSYDITQFSTPVIKTLTDKKEINKLVDLFVDSLLSSEEKSKNILLKLINKLTGKIARIPFYLIAHDNRTVNEAVKSGDKILGGYSMSIDTLKNKGYVNFLALTPDMKGKKSSIELLLNMARRIETNAKTNNIKTIEWTTNNKNLHAFSLFKRFNAQETPVFGRETKFSISVDNFSKTLDKYLGK